MMVLEEPAEIVLGTDPGHRQWLLNGTSSQQNILLSFRGWQYAAFYGSLCNGERKSIYIHLARRPVTRSSWETFAFEDYPQTTDDGHNTIQIGICEGDGTIHLSYDHHSDQLHYRYSKAGIATDPGQAQWDCSVFSSTSDTLPGIATPINGVTYPRFLSVDRDMIFSYRTGMWVHSLSPASLAYQSIRAGLGSERLYIYSSQTGRYNLMGTYLEGVENNPYINGLDYRNSLIHATWTYRDFVPFENWDKAIGVNHKQQAGPNGIENNHDLWYSYSDDLGRSWKNDSGQTVARLDKGESVRPDSDGIKVFSIPKGCGAHNQEDQVIDYNGGVHVLNRDAMSGHMQWKHYYRSPLGTWTQNSLPHGTALLGGKRGVMAVTKQNDLYFILPDNRGTNSGDRSAGDLIVLKATQEREFKDYVLVWRGGRFSSEPRVDRARLDYDDVLSLYLRKEGLDEVDPIRKVGSCLVYSQPRFTRGSGTLLVVPILPVDRGEATKDYASRSHTPTARTRYPQLVNMAQQHDTSKNQMEMVENSAIVLGDGAPAMRAKADDLSVLQSMRKYKRVGIIAIVASFCAALDGYQINLNGGIVSNTGFIHKMASPGTQIIAGQYVSAWGGIQSGGQVIGQVLLQYVTEGLGRKPALGVIWITLVLSIFIETFSSRWDHWLVAKLFSGMGVGMLQSTMPLYLSEIAPTQLRGFFINAYSFWFVIGQLFASVALYELKKVDPTNYKTPIYTQWPMVGLIGIIFVFLPESPWWLASKGKLDETAKALHFLHGRFEGYDVQEQIEVMTATVIIERQTAELNEEVGMWAVFQGRNLLRFLISGWPKITQQFVGLTVFNTYAVYFFQYAGNNNPFLVTVILSCVQLISMILTAAFTDAFGRRPLTVYPYAVTVLSVLCLGIIGCFDYTKPALSSLLIFFACLATFSTSGASAIGYAYAAEIAQQRLRARTAAWSLAVSNLISLMFSFCTPLMINGTTSTSTYKWGVKTGFFFAGTGAIAVIVAWFILPEVARRTPAEIDEMFEKKVNLRKFDNYVTEAQVNANEIHHKAID
ncbi:hypothetical protein V490_04370 [Pseudogymnoascus sp. VKM F-3557]|nr:hypothetical protein V490_04370 [Pseudogymnoascus sp. VKM F-3557]